ncbi:hypothetical protein ABH915_001975 [Arthrobacter sp. MW3 TE3886]|jgi:hypothetical protein
MVNPRGGQREDDLVDPVQTSFSLGHNHRLERPVPIPGHLNLDRADLGQHGLRPGAVAHVGCDRRLAMLVAQVLGQFRFQRGLQHIPRKLAQQPARAYQAHALLLGLREQPFRKLLLIDNLSVTGSIITLVIPVVDSDTTVSFRIKPDPPTPFFLQSHLPGCEDCGYDIWLGSL